MRVLADAVRLSAGTLTVLPVPAPRSLEPRVAALAMVLAPVVVLPVAAVAAAAGWALGATDAPPMLTSALVVAVLALGSGALHLDGLADTADGLAVQGDRGRRLEVMRRGDVGPAGVATLVLVLLVQVAALASVVASRDAGSEAATLCLAVVASRAVLALGCARGVRAARTDGLGSAVAGSVPALLVVFVLGAVAAAAGLVDQWRGVVGVAAAVSVAAVVLVTARHRLGGVTGDVLGACVEVALAAYLVIQVLTV